MIGSLHDLTCRGPDDCTCKAVYIAKPTPRIRQRKLLRSKSHVIPSRVKQDLFEQYGYLCQWCLVDGGALDAHHVLPRSQGGKDRAGDLVPVHRLCHSYIHEHPSEAKARGFLS